MESTQIVSRMNTYLHTSANILSKWLNKILPKASDEWWDECVLDKLSYNQRETVKRKGIEKLDDFDLAALLRITDKSWYMIRNVIYIPSRERECIRDMMRVRNNWAHASATLPGKDEIVADLTTLHLFFEQRECGNSLLREVDEMIEEVKSPSTVVLSNIISEEEEPSNADSPAGDQDIQVMSKVQLVGDPSISGIVLNITDLGDVKKYEVFVNGDCKVFYSGQIKLKQDIPTYNWIDINTFRSSLTAYQINNPSSNDLYSLNSARIDFVPYQFRPALKLIHADEPRILIADSVGVGKTIEAGLIIKELQARHELENILIICPKPLVTEKKWETEMMRFDEEFISVNGPTLRQIISDTDRDGAWPIHYSKTIIPYSILDSRTYLGETTKKSHSFGLVDLDPAPHFDLVIIDEAHHIRNGSMEKEKAFEYKCVKYFCDNADAVVMLTATPLQTSDDDLFTLLNVLRPDIVIDEKTFNVMSRPNKYISEAVKTIRRANDNWQREALASLQHVLETQWGENVIAANPDYKSLIRSLHKKTISREERVQLISYAENLHSFNSMLNRTRRKDIQDFCIRRPFTLAVDFTPRQKMLHDELLLFEQKALLHLHGSSRSISFMMTTIKRQAASCIFGLAPHIKDLINRRFQQLEEDLDYDSPGIPLTGERAKLLEQLANKIINMAQDLPDDDPKFDKMLEVIMEKQKQENNKVIIFSTFRYTLRYLNNKLNNAGIRVGQIDGSVNDFRRQELRDAFYLPKNDVNAIDILLFTEVGSEGLDYQKCNMMINYDLPWNPMRIEQRIGRIDRRGQESDFVSIYNVITNDTVDADIYYRCLLRIGIFEHSIGECDEILGEISAQLDNIAFNSSLSDEERRIKIEQMADNEIRKLQEMTRLEEEEKDLFGIDLSEYMTSREINRAENTWLTQKNLQNLIEQYLTDRLGNGDYLVGDSEIKQIRLSAEARFKIREDFRKLPGGRSLVRQKWENYLKGKSPMHTITFDAEAANKERSCFFITPMHPLAKQAAAHYSMNDKAYIRLQYVSDELPAGRYHFSVYAWNYVGINPHFKMMLVCDNEKVSKDLPDIIQESQSSNKAINITPSDWDGLEKEQVKLWSKEKADAVKEAKSIFNYKSETLTNNYRNKQRSLEQKLKDTASENFRRMYKSQMEGAREAYELKMAEIQKKVDQTDIHTSLIANGILEIYASN